MFSRRRSIKALLFMFLWLTFVKQGAADLPAMPDSTWFDLDKQAKPVINVYFFWSEKCPHCLDALPVMKQMAENNDAITLHSLQLVGQEENIRRYQYMATKLGKSATAVPAFLFCNSMRTGFDINNSPEQLYRDIDLCREHIEKFGNLSDFQFKDVDHVQVTLPFVGTINTNDINSMAVITVVLASIDAFNPCAFFVLMFLLSMMLHTRSRSRMLLVGLVFVFVSGFMYFLFMTAWLNLFRVIGKLDVITQVAGVVSLMIGVINVKDFFWFKKGISLSISGSAKQSLFQRMRGLLGRASLSGTLIATVSLALFANLYEFLCTAGFPMVFTRILTLSGMPEWQYYVYLLLYNLIYILPLLVIVILFTLTVGEKKLQEKEGRRLKLVSGMMMMSLGIMLIVSPDMLQNIVSAGMVLILAILISLLLMIVETRFKYK